MGGQTFDREKFADFLMDLQVCGWEPKVCDTEVRMYEAEVPCGAPDDVGSEMFMMSALPLDLVKDNPHFMVRARGDSMVDIGINPGDVLLVEYGVWPQEQDTVMAYVDGEVTIKTFHTAADGTHWLVPNNAKKNYKAIPLEDHSRVKIAAVVRAQFKRSVRASYKKCEQVVRQSRQVNEPEQEYSEQNVSLAIRTVAQMVKTKRQWYAVYVVMMNYNLVNDGDYEGFCARVKLEVPNHQHLPTMAELQRMAVMSFAKPVSQWKADYAPVTGKRFKDYKLIAQKTEKLLRGE